MFQCPPGHVLLLEKAERMEGVACFNALPGMYCFSSRGCYCVHQSVSMPSRACIASTDVGIYIATLNGFNALPGMYCFLNSHYKNRCCSCFNALPSMYCFHVTCQLQDSPVGFNALPGMYCFSEGIRWRLTGGRFNALPGMYCFVRQQLPVWRL